VQDKCYAGFQNLAHVLSVVMLSAFTLGAVILRCQYVERTYAESYRAESRGAFPESGKYYEKNVFFVETFKQ